MNEEITLIAKEWGVADVNQKKELIKRIVQTASYDGQRLLNQIINRDLDVEIRQAARKACDALEKYLKQKEEGLKLNPNQGTNLSLEEQIFNWLESDKRDLEIKGLVEAQKLKSLRVLEYLKSSIDYFQDDRVRATLVKTLAIIGGVSEVPTIYSFLEDQNPRVRANAIEALEIINHPNVYPVFVQWLSDSDNRVKANCLKALRKIGGNSVNQILSDMLNSDYVSYKESAIYVISLTPSRPGLSLLRNFIYQEYDEELVERALFTIIDFCHKGLDEARDIIYEYGHGWEAMLNQETSDTRSFAYNNDSYSAKSGFDESLLDSPNPDDLKSALKWILDGRLVQYSNKLSELLETQQSNHRITSFIIRLIGELNLVEHLDLLTPYLNSKDDRVRANTVEAIGLFKRNLKYLIPALKDHNNRVKANAIIALKDYKQINVIQHIFEMASDQDPIYRRSALYAIRHLKSDLALSAIEPLLYDEDEIVRQQALDVLKYYEICGISRATVILKQHGDSLFEK